MAIRPSNTVTMLRRQLDDVESGTPTIMELVSLLDEIKRQERKWREFEKSGISRRVNPSDYSELESWLARLKLVMERVDRASGEVSDAERELLRKSIANCSTAKEVSG